MEKQYLLLKDVVQVLGLKAHQIAYALATGQVAEPALRVANKRVFGVEDVERLARHFRVKPRWPSPEKTMLEEEGRTDRYDGLALERPFSVQTAGETCHEVQDGNGAAFCWTADRARALVIAGLLEHACR